MQKVYTTRDLYNSFRRRKIYKGNNYQAFQNMLRRYQKEGKLTTERNERGFRVFTRDQIRAIGDAFSHPGRGEWHCRNKPEKKSYSSLVKDTL